jgi:hypothetical protein
VADRVPQNGAPGPTPSPPYPKRGKRKSDVAPDKDYIDTSVSPKAAPAPDPTLYKQWEKYQQEAMRRREPWIPMWQSIYELVLPNREAFFDMPAAGQSTTDFIYDETAVVGVPRLASRLTSGFFPEAGEIFSLDYGLDVPDHLKGPDGLAKLQLLTQMIHTSWQSSNFPTEISEAMIDFAIGTMNVAQEPGDYPGDVVFKAVPMTHIAILPGAGGTIKGWFQWRDKQPIEDVFQEFEKVGTFPDKFMQDKKIDPRRTLKVHTATWDCSTKTETKYKQLVVIPEYNSEGIIWDNDLSGEGSCPWSTARWSKVGVDCWGRGAIMLVMPAVKTCNLTVQLILENAELALGGVWTYDDDGVFNPDNVTLAPGTFIPKSREGKIEPLQSAANFDVAQLVLQDQRTNIKKGLFIDELDTPGKTPRSAMEIQSRLAEIARDLSAPGSRLVHEFLVHQVNRTIHIFDKQGLTDSMGLRVNGKQLRLTVKSPLLRGQDQIELDELSQWGARVDGLFGPNTAALSLDRKTAMPYIAKRAGIPMTLIRSDEEIAKQMAQAQQAAQMQQATSPAGPEAAADQQSQIMDASTA